MFFKGLKININPNTFWGNQVVLRKTQKVFNFNCQPIGIPRVPDTLHRSIFLWELGPSSAARLPADTNEPSNNSPGPSSSDISFCLQRRWF
jgi:hypothetical protein